MSPVDYYTECIKQKLGFYYAAWLPNVRFELGDVGFLEGMAFRRESSLKELGIDFDVKPDEKASSLDIISGEGATISFKAAGEINAALPNIPAGSAGVSIDFGREGACVIQAEDVHEPSVNNIVKLKQDIIAAYKRGVWDLNWKVIVKLTCTANAVILVSQSANAKVEIAASGNVPVGGFKLTDANVKLAFAHTSGDVVRIDRGADVTPLMQLAGIHWKIWPFTQEARLEKSLVDPAAKGRAPTPEEARSDPAAEAALSVALFS